MMSTTTLASLCLSAGLLIGAAACAGHNDSNVTPAQNRSLGTSGKPSDSANTMDRQGTSDVGSSKTNEDSRTKPGTTEKPMP